MKLSECEAQEPEPPKEVPASDPIEPMAETSTISKRVADLTKALNEMPVKDRDRLHFCEMALARINTAELIVESGLVYVEFDSSQDIAEQILVATTPNKEDGT